MPARQRPRRSPCLTDHDIESERGYGGHSDSEEDDDDNDGWIPGLTAESSDISSDVADQTGPTGMVQDSLQDDTTLDLPVRGSRAEEELAGLAGNLSPIAAPSTLRNSSHRRTLEDYDQTTARIRALNAELLVDTRVQPRSHPYRSQLRTSASRSDRGVGVRYLNVPGAATDALMAVRRRASRRRTSAAGTGIVDISDSESSEFESDDDEELESSPLGTESEAFEVETLVKPRSEAPAISHEQPAASTATTRTESEDRVSVAGPCRAITDPPPPTDAPGLQGRQLRTARDPAVIHHRLQPAHLPALLSNDALTSSTLLPPDPKGKKRAHDPDVDGALWLDSARAEDLAHQGKRRKAAPGASVSVTLSPSRAASITDTACCNRFDTSSARLCD
ncbi:hypothetical protein V8D89_006290 [Ganoderma adspersum]